METGTYTTNQPVPVHPGLPMLGNTLAFLRDPLAILHTLQQRHDRIVHLRIGGRHQYLVMQPEAIHRQKALLWLSRGHCRQI